MTSDAQLAEWELVLVAAIASHDRRGSEMRAQLASVRAEQRRRSEPRNRAEFAARAHDRDHAECIRRGYPCIGMIDGSPCPDAAGVDA